MRSRSDTGPERVLATCSGYDVDFSLSPGRRWLAVSAHRHGGTATHPRPGATILVATDGSFSGAVDHLDPSLSSRGFWAPDDSAFLWMTHQGLGAIELGSDEQPILQQRVPGPLRRLVGGVGTPVGQPCVIGWTAYLAWDVSRARGRTEYVLCRADLRAGKGEVILELTDRGTRWVEAGTFKLDDLEK